MYFCLIQLISSKGGSFIHIKSRQTYSESDDTNRVLQIADR